MKIHLSNLTQSHLRRITYIVIEEVLYLLFAMWYFVAFNAINELCDKQMNCVRIRGAASNICTLNSTPNGSHTFVNWKPGKMANILVDASR